MLHVTYLFQLFIIINIFHSFIEKLFNLDFLFEFNTIIFIIYWCLIIIIILLQFLLIKELIIQYLFIIFLIIIIIKIFIYF